MGNSQRSETVDDRAVRFVVLFHSQTEGDHYDLMIENENALATWKMLASPENSRIGDLIATRIGEHRIAYLDYEGPISGDRGHVTRHDSGTCKLEWTADDEWRVRFEGARLRGRVILKRDHHEPDKWRLQWSSE